MGWPERRKLHLTIVPSWGGKTVHWVVSLWQLRAYGAVFSAMVLALLLSLVFFGRIAASARTARRLGAENDSLRTQFARLGDLERQVAELSRANEQIRRMAGLAPDSAASSSARDPAEVPGGSGGSGTKSGSP